VLVEEREKEGENLLVKKMVRESSKVCVESLPMRAEETEGRRRGHLSGRVSFAWMVRSLPPRRCVAAAEHSG
jgi:hypothetical protein